MFSGEYGNLADDISKLFDKVNRQFGDIVKLEKILGLKTLIQIFDPSDIEKVIKQQYWYILWMNIKYSIIL